MASSKKKVFVVNILDQQNATWQGTVTWTDGQKTASFRSALELLHLIDSGLVEQAKDSAEN